MYRVGVNLLLGPRLAPFFADVLERMVEVWTHADTVHYGVFCAGSLLPPGMRVRLGDLAAFPTHRASSAAASPRLCSSCVDSLVFEDDALRNDLEVGSYLLTQLDSRPFPPLTAASELASSAKDVEIITFFSAQRAHRLSELGAQARLVRAEQLRRLRTYVASDERRRDLVELTAPGLEPVDAVAALDASAANRVEAFALYPVTKGPSILLFELPMSVATLLAPSSPVVAGTFPPDVLEAAAVLFDESDSLELALRAAERL